MVFPKAGSQKVKIYTLFLLVLWTCLVSFSALWMLYQERQEGLELAREAARSQVEKDLILREWNIRHGFVYAPVSSFNQPNPYLQLPERELTTPSGKVFTAINSSTMIRQIYELAQEKQAYQGRLTSLRPLRPENAPDAWETAALLELQKGRPEVAGVTENNGTKFIRLARPLVATARCQLCHAGAEFQAGKVAGAISLTLPLKPFLTSRHKDSIIGVHLFLWCLGCLGLLVGSRNLQQRIQANEELAATLQKQDEEKQILLNNIPALVYRGYADGRVEFVDDKVEKLTGYPKDAFASGELKWPEIILPEDLPEAKRIFKEALKGNKSYRREYRIRTKNGAVVWLAEQSQIVCDENGRISFISGVVSDITVRKEMEQSLAESERFWKSLLEAVGVGIMLTDKANGRVREVNPKAIALLGYPREAIIGRERQQFINYLPPNQTATEPPNRVSGIEAELLRADGSRLPILKTCASLQIEGLTYILESFIDLSAQREAERALAAANARLQQLVHEMNQTNREINLIGRMVELLQVCQNLEEAYPIIEQFAAKLFPDLGGAVYLLNPSNNLLSQVLSWGELSASESVFNPNDCWALRQGKRHRASRQPGAGIDPPCRHVLPQALGDFLCQPLLAQGETLGLLFLQGPQPPAETTDAASPGGGLSPIQERLAISLAENISLALANLRLRESLRYQAIRDSLTGLFNRRYLQETLEREIYRVQRKQATLGVIMLDVDHFKQFNDTHGHEAGDRLLANLGRFLKNSIRAEDIACRYGGEEFTLVLPEISPEVLLQRAEAIRVGVPELEVEYHGQILTGVTVSLGLAYYPLHGHNGDQLLEAADKALYRAKRRGRNRVVMAGLAEEESREALSALDPVTPLLQPPFLQDHQG